MPAKRRALTPDELYLELKLVCESSSSLTLGFSRTFQIELPLELAGKYCLHSDSTMDAIRSFVRDYKLGHPASAFTADHTDSAIGKQCVRLRSDTKGFYNHRVNDAKTSRPKLSLAKPVVKTVPRASTSQHWPHWESPSEADVLILAKTITPFVRFLSPQIVERIVKDNQLYGAEWSELLQARGIDANAYLWPESSCAFPGVRRGIGAQEEKGSLVPANEWKEKQAVFFDTNRYPMHIWSFIFRGRKADTNGPPQFELAHLVDHKPYNKKRIGEELAGDKIEHKSMCGLFTSAWNSCLVSKGLARPTDISPQLRHLLQKRAESLYGGVCTLIPWDGGVRESNPETDWNPSEFDWAQPVGDLSHIDEFLRFRKEELERLLKRTA